MAKGYGDNQRRNGNKKTLSPEVKRRFPIGFDPRKEARRERARQREEARNAEA